MSIVVPVIGSPGRAAVPFLIITVEGPHFFTGARTQPPGLAGSPVVAAGSAAPVPSKKRTGRYADIIAVQGDPLQDITVLQNVGFVMKGGVVYKRDGTP
jgi:hypothetical protein